MVAQKVSMSFVYHFYFKFMINILKKNDEYKLIYVPTCYDHISNDLWFQFLIKRGQIISEHSKQKKKSSKKINLNWIVFWLAKFSRGERNIYRNIHQTNIYIYMINDFSDSKVSYRLWGYFISTRIWELFISWAFAWKNKKNYNAFYWYISPRLK